MLLTALHLIRTVLQLFSDSDKSELDKNFDFLKSTFIDKGIPVIIGEFGSLNKDNTSDRVKHMEYYVSAAKARGTRHTLSHISGMSGV